MTTFRPVASLLIALLVVAGLSFAGWQIVSSRDSHECAACQRPVHRESKTVALDRGKRVQFCCPSCAMSQRKQTQSPIEILSLTNFEDGKPMKPAGAFLVRGSDMSSCAHRASLLAPDKHPAEAHFDRCSPSLLAFATRVAAARFARQHGGEVVPYDAVLSTAR